MPRTRAAYAAVFREQMVELVPPGRTPGELAWEFEPSAEAIRNWVAQAGRDAGKRTESLRSEEAEEHRRLCDGREILANPSTGAPLPVATETRESGILRIEPRWSYPALVDTYSLEKGVRNGKTSHAQPPGEIEYAANARRYCAAGSKEEEVCR